MPGLFYTYIYVVFREVPSGFAAAHPVGSVEFPSRPLFYGHSREYSVCYLRGCFPMVAIHLYWSSGRDLHPTVPRPLPSRRPAIAVVVSNHPPREPGALESTYSSTLGIVPSSVYIFQSCGRPLSMHEISNARVPSLNMHPPQLSLLLHMSLMFFATAFLIRSPSA